jgi:hypothetical protein
MAKKKEPCLEDFFNLKTKEVLPEFEEPRQEASMITQKQIAYVYVLQKQHNIDKEDLEKTNFRHFTSQEARDFIDLIKEGRFYEKYKKPTISDFMQSLQDLQDDDDDFIYF